MAVKTSFFRVLFGGSGRLGLRSPMRSRGASYRLGLLLLPGLLLTVLPLLAQSTIYNVRSYGAKGDGVTDDAPAIQKAELAAENAGGGKVYIPAGSYWMNSAVLVGSNIELYGDGDSTLLHRSNTPSNIPSYTADCTTTKPPTMSLTLLLANRHYNCKDVNIYLHDFKADGSAITTVPSGPFFGFSGLVSSTLANITLVNTPQDGMFFRNGGQNLVVKNNRILLHNTRWGNGSGINVETHVNGEIWGLVTITNNEIIAGATNFCTAALSQSCNQDSDCTGLVPATCGHGNASSAAIQAVWVDGTTPAEVNILNNYIWVGNNHYGIICNGCSQSTISGNIILPAKFRNVPGAGTYTAISSYSTAVTPVQNFTIANNTIQGTGEGNDGPAIVVSGQSSGNGLTIQNNLIFHKNSSIANIEVINPSGVTATALNTSIARPAIDVRGWSNVDVSGNNLCFVPGEGIRVKTPELQTMKGLQEKNTIVSMEKQPNNLPTQCSNMPR